MLNAVLVDAKDLLPTDTIFIGNFRYAIQGIEVAGDVYYVTVDTGYAAVVLADTQVWILERPAPDIHDEDTYEEMREAAATEHLTGVCPITEVKDCESRDCELHYMEAPIRWAFLPPATCPACLGEADHLPLAPGSGCVDAFIGIRQMGF